MSKNEKGFNVFSNVCDYLHPINITCNCGRSYHIGICTETVSQAEDDLRGAEQAVKEYGDVAQGGMIQHLTYPDNFMQEMETVISQIAGLADDPLMKAIVVNNAIPGTTEAFRRVKEKGRTSYV